MRVGEFKIRLLRVMQYANFVTFVASVLAVLKLYELPLWGGLLFLVPFVLLYHYDPGMLKGEYRYMNDNNEDWQSVKKDIELIKRRMDEFGKS